MSAESFAELPPAAEDAAEELFVGNAGVPRFLAAQLDHGVGVILFFAVGMTLPQFVGEVVAGFTAFGAYLGYYFLMEWLCGATIGKLLSNLSVRQLNGERCTAGQIALRTLFRLVEVNILLLGGLPAGVAIISTKHRQRLGDLLAGTVVIRAPSGYDSGRPVTIRSKHNS
jgi:uncharacterized RDD family membrane protein YckC